MEPILVTGASGNVGREVVRLLLRQGRCVVPCSRGLDDQMTKDPLPWGHPALGTALLAHYGSDKRGAQAKGGALAAKASRSRKWKGDQHEPADGQ